MKPIFLLKGVSKRRFATGGAPEFELIINEIRIYQGQKIAIVGPSGSGKSTLVDLLIFTSKPFHCELFQFHPLGENVKDIGKMWSNKSMDGLADLRKRYIGVILQSGGLLKFASVQQNIDLPRRLLGLPKDDTVNKLANRLGIDHLLNKLPEKISVGERQRVAIARALAHNPSVIIADEPTASLDKNNAQQVMELLIELVNDAGMILIITSHDRQLIDRNKLQIMEYNPIEGQDSCTRSSFGM